MSVFITLGDSTLSGPRATTHGIPRLQVGGPRATSHGIPRLQLSGPRATTLGIPRLQTEISSCHIWHKQSLTIDKKWFSTGELGEGLKTPYHKGQHVMNVQEELRSDAWS
jgi:hypothetical protein